MNLIEIQQIGEEVFYINPDFIKCVFRETPGFPDEKFYLGLDTGVKEITRMTYERLIQKFLTHA